MSTYDDGFYLIPSHMHAGVTTWIENGIATGSFLMAVLRNDLMQAAQVADHVNGDHLKQWTQFLYNYAPSECFGSPETVEAWAESGGLVGQAKARESGT